MRRIDLKKANAARSNTIRDINRQIVLNYVRELGPLSRADIARETALQRSTISLIVEELRVDGLIEEVGGESTGGRPPSLLSLRTADAVAIGIDLGTVKTVMASSDLAGRVLEQEEFPTDNDVKKTLDKIVYCAQRLIRKNKGTIEGIGISLPGVVDPETGNLYVPHFRWRNEPIAKTITHATSLPVSIDNDANAAALAELWFGRPEIREVRDFILVLVEEGVGTGIVFDGQVYRGEGGTAGEFGHMTIGSGAPVQCAVGSRECWEAFASERAALARYQKLSRSNGSKDVNFADGEVGCSCGGNAEPGIQLRTATRASASTGEFIFSFAVKIASRERIFQGDLVIHFHNKAVGGLPAVIIHDKRTSQVQRRRRIKSHNVQA